MFDDLDHELYIERITPKLKNLLPQENYTIRRRMKPEEYRMLQVPFYSETTNAAEYCWKSPIRKETKATNSNNINTLPFYDETTSKAAFVPFIPERTSRSNYQDNELNKVTKLQDNVNENSNRN
uniref:Uncharacterized protein n=1 Tax=Syphacia muris TaxID=451379 RepID=A0A0N5AKU7_9BILA